MTVVAVFPNNDLASDPQLRIVGKSGITGRPVAGRLLPTGIAVGRLLEFTVPVPTTARQCRFTFVCENDQRETDRTRSTFVRVIELKQQAGPKRTFLGFVGFGDTPFDFDRNVSALSAYAAYVLEMHVMHRQPIQTAFCYWLDIIASLDKESKLAGGLYGSRTTTVRLGGWRQSLAVMAAAAAAKLMQSTIQDSRPSAFTRSTLLLMMVCHNKHQGADATALRNLGQESLETLAELLMPPSSDATRLLLGDLESNDSKQRLGMIISAMLPRLVTSDTLAWVRVLPLLCRCELALGSAFVIDHDTARRIRQHWQRREVEMAQLCEQHTGLVPASDIGGISRSIMRCSSLVSLQAGNLEFSLKHPGGSAVALVCGHLPSLMIGDFEPEAVCSIISKLCPVVVHEDEESTTHRAAVVQLIRDTLKLHTERDLGNYTRISQLLRVVSAAMSLLGDLKSGHNSLATARDMVVQTLRRCFHHAQYIRRSLENPAKLYEVLLPTATETCKDAFVVPLIEQLQLLPPADMIRLFPKLLGHSQKKITEIATEHAMAAITEISRDSRSHSGLYNSITTLFSKERELHSLGKALSVLFQTGCPNETALFHENVANLMSWAMWPTFMNLDRDVMEVLHGEVQRRIRSHSTLIQDLVSSVHTRDIDISTARALATHAEGFDNVLKVTNPTVIKDTRAAVARANKHADIFDLEFSHNVSLRGLCETIGVSDISIVRDALQQRGRQSVIISAACDDSGSPIYFSTLLPDELSEVLPTIHALAAAQTFLDGAWRPAGENWANEHGETKPMISDVREIFDVAFGDWQKLAHAIQDGSVALKTLDSWFRHARDGDQLLDEFAVLARTASSSSGDSSPPWVFERAKQVELSHRMAQLKDWTGPVVLSTRVLGLNLDGDSNFEGFSTLVNDQRDFGETQLGEMTEDRLSSVNVLAMFQDTNIAALRAIADVCSEDATERTLLHFLREDDIYADERFAEFERLATAQAQSTKETRIIALLAKTRTAIYPMLRLGEGGDPIEFTDFLTACQDSLSAPDLSDAIISCAAELSWLEDRLKTVNSTVSSAAREELQRVVDTGVFRVIVSGHRSTISDDRIEQDCDVACVCFYVQGLNGVATRKTKSLEKMRSMQAKLTLLSDEDDAEDVKERVEFLSQWIDALRKLAQTACRAKAACLPAFDQPWEVKERFGHGKPDRLRQNSCDLAAELAVWATQMQGYRTKMRCLNYFDTFSLKAIHRCIRESVSSADVDAMDEDAALATALAMSVGGGGFGSSEAPAVGKSKLPRELVLHIRCIHDDFDHQLVLERCQQFMHRDPGFADEVLAVGEMLESVYESRQSERKETRESKLADGLELQRVVSVIEQRPLVAQKLLLTLHMRSGTTPAYENTLLCTDKTSADEVSRLLLRAMVGNRTTAPDEHQVALFALVSVDRLSINVQKCCLEFLTEAAQSSSGGEMWSRLSALVVIAAKDCHVTRGLTVVLGHPELAFENVATEEELRQYLYNQVFREPCQSQNTPSSVMLAGAGATSAVGVTPSPCLIDLDVIDHKAAIDLTDDGALPESPVPVTQDALAAALAMFSCPACTFQNAPGMDHCEVCEAPIDRPPSLTATNALDAAPQIEVQIDFKALGTISRIQVVENDRASGSGVGKSTFVRSQARLVADACCQDVDCVYSWVPLNGKIDALSLARVLPAGEVRSPRLIHINLGADIEGDVDTLVFNFCVLGVVFDDAGMPCHRECADTIMLELAHPPHAASCDAGDDVGNDARRFSMYHVLRTVVVPGPKLLHAQGGQPLGYFIDPQVHEDINFQRVVHYLEQLSTGTPPSAYDGPFGEVLPPSRCLELLLTYRPRHGTEHADMETWIALDSFWRFLACMLSKLDEECTQADFFEHGFRPFAVEFLVKLSIDFCADNINTVALAQHRDRDGAGDIAVGAGADVAALELSNPQAKWGDSLHPLMTINCDNSGSFSFFGFRIGSDGWIMPPGDMPRWMFDSTDARRKELTGHVSMEDYDPAGSRDLEVGYQAFQQGGPDQLQLTITSRNSTYTINYRAMEQQTPDGQTRAIVRELVGMREDLPDHANPLYSLRRQMMSLELRAELGLMVDMTGGGNWDRETRLLLLYRVAGLGKHVTEYGCHDPDSEYILTDDNMKKILAVLLRFNCSQPAVVMGETGCGKTAMVTFIAKLLDPPVPWQSCDIQTLFVLRVDGGTTAAMAQDCVATAVEAARELGRRGAPGKVLLFADEVNACCEMGFFSDLFCERRVFGVDIQPTLPLNLIAACNPYKKHSLGMIRRLEQAGLGFKETRHLERGIGGVPMRQLVYRVSPLPQSLEQLVFDFGSLDSNVEKSYVADIVKRRLGAACHVAPAQFEQPIAAMVADKEVRVVLVQVGKRGTSEQAALDAATILLKAGDTWQDIQGKVKRKLQIFAKEADTFSRYFSVVDMASGEPVLDFGAVETGALLAVKAVIEGLTAKQLEQFTEQLVRCQTIMRERADECAFVSLRDVERAVAVFEFFWARRMQDSVSDGGGDAFTTAVIASISVCYRCKLTEGSFADFDARVTAGGALNGAEAEKVGTEIHRIQALFADNLHVEDANIAKNHALSENAFVMIICIELCIPLTLIGKPGSSKSLAKLIIKNNLQGPLNGRTPEFYRPFKQVAYVEYLCSPHSTGEAIEEVVALARAMQKERSGQPFAAVVVLDEVGLAEDSKHLPLKVLHRLLDDRDVAFLGISNWALDPAKMNRGLFLNRGSPTKAELQFTALQMISQPKPLPHMSVVINGLSEAYHDVALTKQPPEQPEFFGLRDFYLLVKHLDGVARRSGRPLLAADLEHSIRRNFGGAGNVKDVLEVFQGKLGLDEGVSDAAVCAGASGAGGTVGDRNGAGDGNFMQDEATLDPTLQLVARAMDPTLRMDGRFVLALTRSDTQMALEVLFSPRNGGRGGAAASGSVLPADSTDVIFGSSFPHDQHFSKACRDVSKVKMAMSTGRTIVLVDADYIHESLYDLLNQYYVSGMGRNYAQIGLGKERDLAMVDERFRLMVLASSEHALRAYPTPLLNRFEKHEVTLDCLLTKRQRAVKDRLSEWVRRFCRSDRALGPARRKRGYSERACLVGFNDETITSLVLGNGGADVDSEFEQGVSCLLQIATADAVARASLHMSVHLLEQYFSDNVHEGGRDAAGAVQDGASRLFASMVQAANARALGTDGAEQAAAVATAATARCRQPDCIVTTFSAVLPSGGAGVKVVVLHEFDVEHEFVASCEEILRDGNTELLVVACSMRHLCDNAKLVGFARYLLDNMPSRRKRKDVAVCMLVHLERALLAADGGGACVVIPFSPKWGVVHIDSLVQPSQCIPRFSSLLLRPMALSEHMALPVGSEGAVDLQAALLLAVQPALARLRPRGGPLPELHSKELIEHLRGLFSPGSCGDKGSGGGAELRSAIAHRVLAVIRDREAQSGGPEVRSRWVTRLMADDDAVAQCGTAMKVVELHVERWVSQALAIVLARALTHGGLCMLFDNPGWAKLSTFALRLLRSDQLVPIVVERAANGRGFANDCGIEQQVEVDATIAARLPFSWALYRSCASLRVVAEERSSTEGQPLSRCLRALLQQKLVAALTSPEEMHTEHELAGAKYVGPSCAASIEADVEMLLSSVQLTTDGGPCRSNELGDRLLHDMVQLTQLGAAPARASGGAVDCDDVLVAERDASMAVQQAVVRWYAENSCAEEQAASAEFNVEDGEGGDRAAATVGTVPSGYIAVENLCVGLWRAQPLLIHLTDLFRASMSTTACMQSGNGLAGRVLAQIRGGCLSGAHGDIERVAVVVDVVCRQEALAMLRPQAGSFDALRHWMCDIGKLRWAFQHPFAAAEAAAAAAATAASAREWRKLDLVRQLVQGLFADAIRLTEQGYSSADLEQQLARHQLPGVAIECARVCWEMCGTESVAEVGSRDGLELLLHFLCGHCKRMAEELQDQLAHEGTKAFDLFEPCAICFELPGDAGVYTFFNSAGESCGHIVCAACALGTHLIPGSKTLYYECAGCHSCQEEGGFDTARPQPAITAAFEELKALRHRSTAFFVAVAQHACAEAALAQQQQDEPEEEQDQHRQHQGVFELLADVLAGESAYFTDGNENESLLKLKQLADAERDQLFRSFLRPLARAAIPDGVLNSGIAVERPHVEQLLNDRVLVQRHGAEQMQTVMRTFVENTEDELHASLNSGMDAAAAGRAVLLLRSVRGAKQAAAAAAVAPGTVVELQQVAAVRFALCVAASVLEERARGVFGTAGHCAACDALVSEAIYILQGSDGTGGSGASGSGADGGGDEWAHAAAYTGTELRLVRLFFLKQIARRPGGSGFDPALLLAIGRAGGGEVGMQWLLDEVRRGASEMPDNTLCLVANHVSQDDEALTGGYGTVRAAALELDVDNDSAMLQALRVDGSWRWLLLLLSTARGWSKLSSAVAGGLCEGGAEAGPDDDGGSPSRLRSSRKRGYSVRSPLAAGAAVPPAPPPAADGAGAGASRVAALLQRVVPACGRIVLASVAAGSALVPSAEAGSELKNGPARTLLYVGESSGSEDEEMDGGGSALASAVSSRFSAVLAHVLGLLLRDTEAASGAAVGAGNAPLLRPCTVLFLRPQALAAVERGFLPGMPSPEEFASLLAAETTQYRECRNGHLYLVGDCGEHGYTSKSKCPECQVPIGGGSDSRMVDAGSLATRTPQNRGFCLAPPPAIITGSGDEPLHAPALRSLPPVGVALVRALLAATLLLGRAAAIASDANGGNLERAAGFEQLLHSTSRGGGQAGEVEAVEDCFARHFEAAMASLCCATSLQPDEAAIVVHEVLEKLGAAAAVGPVGFEAAASRDAWEAAVWKVAAPMLVPEARLRELLDAAHARCAAAGGGGGDKCSLHRELLEQEPDRGRVPASQEAANATALTRRAWRFRAHPSIAHFGRELASAGDVSAPVLRALLPRVRVLAAVRWLPRVVRLQETVLLLLTSVKLQQETQQEGREEDEQQQRGRTIGELLSRLSLSERAAAEADVGAFGCAVAALRAEGGAEGDWFRKHLPNRIQSEFRKLRARFGTAATLPPDEQLAFETHLPTSISLASPASWFTPGERGVGVLALAVGLALSGVQNEFLRLAQGAQQPQQLGEQPQPQPQPLPLQQQQRAIPASAARQHHLCGHADSSGLLRVVLRHARHCQDYGGTGAGLAYDLEAAEEQAREWVVAGRREVDTSSLLAAARRHRRAAAAAAATASTAAVIAGADTLQALQAVVPQAALSESALRTLVAELAAHGDVPRAQSTLETAMAYLAAVGGAAPRLALREFLQCTLLMPAANCLVAATAEAAGREVRVMHVESLWWALDVHAAAARARGPGGDSAVFGGLEPAECLGSTKNDSGGGGGGCELDESQRAALRAALARGGAGFRTLLLGALRRCGSARLCGGAERELDMLAELEWPLAEVLVEYALPAGESEGSGGAAEAAGQQLQRQLAAAEGLTLKQLVQVFVFVAEAEADASAATISKRPPL
jgi:hypothetical protein